MEFLCLERRYLGQRGPSAFVAATVMLRSRIGRSHRRHKSGEQGRHHGQAEPKRASAESPFDPNSGPLLLDETKNHLQHSSIMGAAVMIASFPLPHCLSQQILAPETRSGCWCR